MGGVEAIAQFLRIFEPHADTPVRFALPLMMWERKTWLYRTLRRDDYKRDPYQTAASFVPEGNLIGRAFFVFWPLNPFKDQFRLKLIR